ncbi:hypothetical protein L1049_021954 [Liquidambar formosana]|uniref:Uncharacterized protein n=1 Tax=Liquidambar formosana TaxID=63359 RepID=A0AAP0WQ77_LIQFO
MATQAASSSSRSSASPNGDTSSSSSSSSSASSAIDFLSLCHRLKTTKRAGWVRREVQEPGVCG